MKKTNARVEKEPAALEKERERQLSARIVYINQEHYYQYDGDQSYASALQHIQ